MENQERIQVTGGTVRNIGIPVICRDCGKKFKVNVRTHVVIESCPCGRNDFVMIR